MTIQNEARASYVGIGRRQIVEQTFWQIPWWRPVDPLAQTFMLTEDRYITAVDLFFLTKDPVADLTVQIRQVTNGYPSMNVLTSKVVKADAVKLAEVSETVVKPIATKVTFPDPVFLQANVEYSIVLLTASSQYRTYVARMAQTDLQTKKTVSRQPYDIGVLFSSSNGSAWTAHQDMDLKFRLYGAKFKEQSFVYFKKVTAEQATHLLLAADQFVPQRSEVHWEYSEDGEVWYPLASQDITRLEKSYDSIYLRGKLRSSGSSPAIQKQLSVNLMSFDQNGTYVSRESSFHESFNRVTVYIEFSTPSGTDQFVEYTVDGVNWKSMGSAQSTSRIDQSFMQLKFVANLETVSKSIRIRILQSKTAGMQTPKARNLMVHTSMV